MVTVLATAAFGLLVGGCGCVSVADARARDNALDAQNRARAAPAIEQAATALRAVLRPETPVALRTPRPCAARPGVGSPGIALPYADSAPSADVECIETIAAGVPIYRLVKNGTERRLFVAVLAQHADHARLAIRGRTVYILTPKVTREVVDSAERCECDSAPRPASYELNGFVIPDQDFYEVKATDVPMTFDYVDWSCRAHAD